MGIVWGGAVLLLLLLVVVVGVVDVLGVLVVELVVELLVLGVLVVVVVLWRQSWAVSCSTVLTPCLRLFTSVELIDAGRLSTALCSPVAALAAAPHCLAASADETWSSWPFRLLA
jgi:hypothetical protein